MTDVVGVFEQSKQVTATINSIVRQALAPRSSIQVIEPGADNSAATMPLQASSALQLTLALTVGGVLALLLSLGTLAVFGFGFCLAAIAAGIIAFIGGASQNLTLEHRKHLEDGRTVVIVSVEDAAVDRVLSAFHDHGAVEASTPA